MFASTKLRHCLGVKGSCLLVVWPAGSQDKRKIRVRYLDLHGETHQIYIRVHMYISMCYVFTFPFVLY
jgi:hypothetical protein